MENDDSELLTKCLHSCGLPANAGEAITDPLWAAIILLWHGDGRRYEGTLAAAAMCAALTRPQRGELAATFTQLVREVTEHRTGEPMPFARYAYCDKHVDDAIAHGRLIQRQQLCSGEDSSFVFSYLEVLPGILNECNRRADALNTLKPLPADDPSRSWPDAALPAIPQLDGEALKAAEYIRENPGSVGKQVAEAIGKLPETFRRDIVPRLYAHGFFNPGGGKGYFPPTT